MGVRAQATSIASILLALIVGSPASAEPPRLGGELQVNTYTTGAQNQSAAAMDAAGDFVVVWASSGQDGSDYGLWSRRFSRSGDPLGGEIAVNLHTAGAQALPSVAMDADGDFVTVWKSTGQDGSGDGTFARRFASTGTALGSELQVNTYTVGDQVFGEVASESNGDFVVVWNSPQDGDSSGIFARRFTSAGVAIGVELQVNTFTQGTQTDPNVASDGDGDFVVTWDGYNQDASGYGVFARRFSSAGIALGVEFQVNLYTPGYQGDPSVAAGAGGDFVVAWTSQDQDGSTWGVFARRFSSSGAPVAGEILVNNHTADAQQGASVASDPAGGFVVAWTSDGQDGDLQGVFARRFSSTGAALESEFQVNTYTAAGQFFVSAAMASPNRFVVSWTSFAQDGSLGGIFAQPFAGAIDFDLDGNGQVQPLTDALLLLRYSFGFRGAVLVTGAIDVVNCTRCSSTAIEAYIAAHSQ